MKFLTLALIVFTASEMAITQSNPFEGCMYLTKDGKCAQCYQRKVRPDGNGCGPLEPFGDNCSIYAAQYLSGKAVNNYCSTCKPGFSLKKSTNQQTQVIQSTCINGVIIDCVIEFLDTANLSECEACNGQLYSYPMKGLRAYYCKEIANPIANCMWGSYAPNVIRDGAVCWRCKDGYTLVDTLSKCQKISSLPGCLAAQSTTACDICNPYTGYSINAQGKCFKGASAQEVDSSKVRKALRGILGL